MSRTLDRDEHYWIGALSMTLAVASTTPDPQPIIKSGLEEFLADRPPGNELGDMLRTTINGKGRHERG